MSSCNTGIVSGSNKIKTIIIINLRRLKIVIVVDTSPQKSTLITHAWLPILLRPCSHNYYTREAPLLFLLTGLGPSNTAVIPKLEKMV